MKNLENVSALVVLNCPSKTPQYCSDLLWVEEGKQPVKEHFQLHWHCVEALKVVLVMK